MARPLEFDRDAALDSALRLFWQQGYTATSLSQLLHAMQISRSSFYAAYGDKRSLFIEVLALFRKRTAAILEECRERYGAHRAVTEFFRHTMLGVPARRTRRGCMMVNTVLELADVDDELSSVASAHLDTIEQGFEQCLRDARRAGELPARSDPAALARHLMLLNQGLRVASRQGKSRRELAELINSSLPMVGLPQAA